MHTAPLIDRWLLVIMVHRFLKKPPSIYSTDPSGDLQKSRNRVELSQVCLLSAGPLVLLEVQQTVLADAASRAQPANAPCASCCYCWHAKTAVLCWIFTVHPQLARTQPL